MAKIEFTMPDDFMEKISRLEERTDEVLERVLEAGGEVVLGQVCANLSAVIGRGTQYPSRSTGQLAGALGLSPAELDRDGNMNVKVGFDESRADGSANAMVANVIEFGKHDQPPKPFLAPAKSKSEAACVAAMQAKLEQELDGI
ncbi:MAG: HK97 gp10 family phage protein [Oscillospiraceae bacterium]|jgi:hypothetical protein|nr:HK97 gp10 family phage protein [Oscillospiraceae bacterium]